MIPINQSGAVTPLIYTHVTMLSLDFISKAWLLDAWLAHDICRRGERFGSSHL